MSQFIYNNVKHILCLLILVSRLGDIISTYLVSPTLKLEANPIVSKLGFRFTFLTVFICLIPYYHTGLAVMVLVPSLLVTSSNISKYWVVKTAGEEEFSRSLLILAGKSRLSRALFSVLASSFFVIFTGGVLLLLCPESSNRGNWFAKGIILYGFIMALYGSLSHYRLFKQARRISQTDLQQDDIQST
jgi:hypothetical protein